MAPDRVMGKHPRAAAYFVLAMAMLVLGMTVWVYLLSGRVSDGEAIRRVEQQSAAQRQKLGLRFAQALVDVSICIPVTNLQDVLNGTTLTAAERRDRQQAKQRYMEKLAEIRAVAPAVRGCDQ